MSGEEEPTWRERLGRYGLWMAGMGALAAWFAMLWFMFGDVL